MPVHKREPIRRNLAPSALERDSYAQSINVHQARSLFPPPSRVSVSKSVSPIHQRRPPSPSSQACSLFPRVSASNGFLTARRAPVWTFSVFSRRQAQRLGASASRHFPLRSFHYEIFA